MAYHKVKLQENSEISNIHWAQMATWIDSEGCIGISSAMPDSGNKSLSYKCNLSVANTDPRVAQWIMAIFKVGFVQVRKLGRGKDGHKRKTRWDWKCCSSQTEWILRNCYPYLCCKKGQADIIFAMRDLQNAMQKRGRGNHGHIRAMSAEEENAREGLKQQLHILKRVDYGEVSNGLIQ